LRTQVSRKRVHRGGIAHYRRQVHTHTNAPRLSRDEIQGEGAKGVGNVALVLLGVDGAGRVHEPPSRLQERHLESHLDAQSVLTSHQDRLRHVVISRSAHITLAKETYDI